MCKIELLKLSILDHIRENLDETNARENYYYSALYTMKTKQLFPKLLLNYYLDYLPIIPSLEPDTSNHETGAWDIIKTLNISR